MVSQIRYLLMELTGSYCSFLKPVSSGLLLLSSPALRAYIAQSGIPAILIAKTSFETFLDDVINR
jgi:hypothetical protein